MSNELDVLRKLIAEVKNENKNGTLTESKNKVTSEDESKALREHVTKRIMQFLEESKT
jgi:hypothetical protein